jgi:hypothetical protein
MVKTPSFKRLILRAVLRQVSPMVIRLVSVFPGLQDGENQSTVKIECETREFDLRILARNAAQFTGFGL